MKSHVRSLRQPSYHWRMERKEIKYNAIHVCKSSEAMMFEQHPKLTYQHLLSWMAQQRCRNVKKSEICIYNRVQQPSTANSTVLGRLFRCLAPSPKKAFWRKGRRSAAATHLKLETKGAQQQRDFPVSFTMS